jgi:hypothetical protein
MPVARDLTGLRFGRLTVLARAHRDTSSKVHWLCRCDCGTVKTTNGAGLRLGSTVSCGCFNAENARRIGKEFGGGKTIHGMSNTPEFRAWRGMKDRCYNPKHESYANYGGRGIIVCDAWVCNFVQFFAEMGPRPSAKHSIDRIDNDGPYSPDNCRWATRLEQEANKRSNKVVEVNGDKVCLAEAARRLGLNENLVRSRVRRGRPIAGIVYQNNISGDAR